MAKWKWREEKKPTGGNYSVEAVDYGWYCENCGTDLSKYLCESGYRNTRNMISMKRKKPRVEHCPHCGEAME